MTDIRFLQVTINGLKVRTTPAGNSAGAELRQGDIIEVDYEKQVEQDGLIWVQHDKGWSAIRPITLAAGQRAYVEDITHEVPAEAVLFTVRYASLNVRDTPNGNPNEYVVVSNDLIIGEKLPDGQPTNGGHMWWQHKLGWTSEQHGNTIYMSRIREMTNARADLTEPPAPLINPASTSTPIQEPPITTPGGNGGSDHPPTDDDGIYYFRVITSTGINVRKSHDATSEKAGFVDFGQVVAVHSYTPHVAGDYRWLNLTNGNWVAMGPKDSTIDWLEQIEKPAEFAPTVVTQENIHELPLWRALFTDFPVRFPPERDWFQYFGNTVFAFTNGHKYNYDGYSQGLHGGLDFGSSAKSLDVFARVKGEVVKIVDRSGARNQVHVKSGPYLIIYLHLENHTHVDLRNRDDLPYVGQTVTPDTFIGKTLFGPGQPNHLHFEVRYKEDMIINPLELMSESASSAIIARYNPKASGNDISQLRRFYKTDSWSQWYTPFDQPVIQLRKPVIGPKAK